MEGLREFMLREFYYDNTLFINRVKFIRDVFKTLTKTTEDTV